MIGYLSPVYQMTSGTIYLALKSLYGRGLVSREEKVCSGRMRIYYMISKEGEIYLNDLRDKLKSKLENLQTLFMEGNVDGESFNRHIP